MASHKLAITQKNLSRRDWTVEMGLHPNMKAQAPPDHDQRRNCVETMVMTMAMTVVKTVLPKP